MTEGSLKTHQVAPGEGESVYPNVNDSSMSQQPVDLQTVGRLHVPDAVVGDALNVYSKGQDRTAGRNSTALNNERLSLQQQNGTVQCHVPLTQGGPAHISGGGDDVGVQQQHNTAQNSTGQTEQVRQSVTGSGRQGVDSAALDTTRNSEPA